MKPPRFDYAAPKSLDEALALLATHGDRAKILAGGQSLVPLLNFRLAHPELVVDINRLQELAYVRERDGHLAIGALTRQHALERSDVVRSRAPLVAEACRFIGHLPIRHRGTIGGNLAHADPASELPAVMLALEARFALARGAARRTVAADAFFRGPLDTALEPGELLAEVEVPVTPPRTGTAFVEMSRRAGDFAIVGVAAAITLAGDGRCSHARIALCGAASTPIRARAAEEALVGHEPAGAALDEAAARAAAATSPPSDVHGSADYRRKLARHLTRRAIALAADRARGA